MKRKAEIIYCPASELVGQILFIEWEDDRYYHGYYLNKYGKIYVEVPKEYCEEIE